MILLYGCSVRLAFASSKRAIEKASARAKESNKKPIKHFQPYVLRHTALTQLAQAGCDAFTLARIAGHSSITITQRYIHPQADAIERAFAPFGANTGIRSYGHKDLQVGSKLDTAQTDQISEALQLIAAKGHIRPVAVSPTKP